jgi:UDP-glucose 4-epimerase
LLPAARDISAASPSKIYRQKAETVVVLDNLVYGHRQAVGESVAFYDGNIGDKHWFPK